MPNVRRVEGPAEHADATEADSGGHDQPAPLVPAGGVVAPVASRASGEFG
jgi:hypothetical protein